MNISGNYEQLSRKLEGLSARIKQFFQLQSCPKTNLHTDIASVRHDADETQLVPEKAAKQIRNKNSRNQIEVPCTSKVRKGILKNLHAVAVCRAGATRPISECERVKSIMQAAADTRKSNSEPSFEFSPEAKEVRPLNPEEAPEIPITIEDMHVD